MSSRLQALLIGERVLPEETVRAAVARQLVYGGGLDTALMEMGAMTEAAIWARLAAATGLPVPAPALCDGSKVAAEPALAADSTARLRVVPVDETAHTLKLLCAEPVAADDIRRAAAERGFEARLYIVPEVRLLALRQRVYGEPLPQRFAGLLARAVGAESARRNFASPRRQPRVATVAATATATASATVAPTATATVTPVQPSAASVATAAPPAVAATATTETPAAVMSTPAARAASATPAPATPASATVPGPASAEVSAPVTIPPAEATASDVPPPMPLARPAAAEEAPLAEETPLAEVPPSVALVWDAASEEVARADGPPPADLLWDAASEEAADADAARDHDPPAADLLWDAASEEAAADADAAEQADDAPPSAPLVWDASSEEASDVEEAEGSTPLQQVIEHSAPYLINDESIELDTRPSGAQPMDPIEDQSLSVSGRLALASPFAFPERLTPGSGVPVGLSAESLTDSATEALCRRARDREDKGRRLALRALRRRMRQPPVRALIAELMAKATADTPDAAAALDSLVELREERAIPILLGRRSTTPPQQLDEEARRGLVVLTGQDFGRDPGPWEDWCLANAESHRVEWLLQGLAHRQQDVRAQAFDELRHITGDTFGYRPELSRRKREAARRRWAEWWEQTSGARRA